MPGKVLTRHQLQARNAELEQRLAEAEETLAAVAAGEVDAVVVGRGGVKRVYTLHGADESYRTIVEQMDEGAITVSADGEVLYANTRFADLVRSPLGRVIGANIFQFAVHAETVEALLRVERGSPRKAETALRTSEGRETPVSLAATAIDLDTVRCVCLVVVDQTPQKRNEELAASEKLARAILESASEPIMVLDRNGVIIRANAAAHKFHGRNVLLEPVDKAFADAHSVRKLYERALAGESATGEPATVAIRAGVTANVLTSAGPMRSEQGEVIGAVVTFTDITERERAERLRRALTAVNAAIHSTLDFNEILQRVVDEAANALDCDNALLSVRHGSYWVVSHVHRLPANVIGMRMSDDKERHAVLAIQSRKPVAIDDAFTDHRVNQEHLREWGVRSVLTVPLVIRNEALGVIFFNYQRSTVVFADYHLDFATNLAASLSLALENARLFEDLNRQLAELEHAQRQLEARTRELERSNEDLQRFAYVASHDLQEPLRTIASYTQLLLDRNEGRLHEESGEFAEFILTGVRRMKTLIRDLLEFSRVAAAGGQRTVATDCNVLLGFVLDHLRLKIAERGAQITSDPLPTVEVNDSALMRVFQNLLSNAIQYCETAPVIRVSACRRGEEWLFSVKDNGIGIQPEYCEKIFGLFKRLHPAGKHSGTGIGLAICRRIIEQHGGRIWVESAVGAGSTFFFTLPYRQEEATDACAGN